MLYKVKTTGKDYFIKAKDSTDAVKRVRKVKDAFGDYIINSLGLCGGKKREERVGASTLEEAKRKVFTAIRGFEEGYNAVLQQKGLGKVKLDYTEGTTSKPSDVWHAEFKFTNKNIQPATYYYRIENHKAIKDSAIKDERLSPMTYRKLKEYGYNSNQWKNLSQEQANKIVQQHENKQSNSTKKENTEETKKVKPGYTKEYLDKVYSEKELSKFDESGLATFYLNMNKQREKYIDKYKQSGKAPNKTELSKRADLLFDVMGRAEKVLRNKWGYDDKDFEALENENGMYARTKAERKQETKNKEQKQGKNKYGVERSMLGTPQHAKAVDCMQELDIYKPYIRGFRESGRTCFFEDYAGYWTDQEPEIFDKQQEIEKEYGCQVFAITHDLTEMGEMYSFLIVPEKKSEWKDTVEKQSGNTSFAYAYVWNKDNPDFSEFGTIAVKSFGGGIKRVG